MSERASSIDPDLRTLLEARARALAERRLLARSRRVVATVIAARRDRSLWGFPIEAAQDVQRVRAARLPMAPAAICGTFARRGRVHSLLDLAALLGPAAAIPHDEGTLAITISHGGKTLGVRIDEVIGTLVIHEDEIDASHQRRLGFVAAVAVVQDGHAAFALAGGRTGTPLELIDVAALFASPAVHLERG